MYLQALVKSIPFHAHYEEDNRDYPTYEDIAEQPTLLRNRVSFLSVPYNVGSTTHYDPRQRNDLKASFGCPRYFFCFNFTSAVISIPYAFVDWCQFRAKSFHRTSFEGDITQAEWTNGPRQRRLISPFITLDDIVPSRFALAYDSILDVAFVALDPERIGDAVDDGMITDLGDNVLTYRTDFNLNDSEDAEEDEGSGGDESEGDDESSVDSDDSEAEELIRGKAISLSTLIKFLSYDDNNDD